MQSVKEAADTWGVSPTTVRKWISQGRVLARKVGSSLVVLSPERPEPLRPGGLSPEARARWNYGSGYKPTDG